jgi:LysM repeat protein
VSTHAQIVSGHGNVPKTPTFKPMRPPAGKPAASAAPDAPAAGLIVIRREDNHVDLVAIVGDGTPKVSAGGGGWQSVARDGRVATQWWNGREPAAVTLPVVFGDDPGRGPVDARARQLEALWGVGLRDDQEPPAVRFNSGGLVPLDATDPRARDWRWTVSACEEADGVIRDLGGQRIYATYTITLQRIVEDELVLSEATKRRLKTAKSKAARKKARKPAPKRKHHTTKKGDTLAAISVENYGTPDGWPTIAEVNNMLKHPTAEIPAGKRLVMP